jgi:hypothetical protein
MANKEQVFEILTILAAAYPRFSLTKETIKVYAKLLQDLDSDELRAAALDCAAKRDFFPSIHELRSTVVELRKKSNQVPTAFEAWSELLQAGSGSRLEIVEVKEVETSASKWGIRRNKFVFSHPLIEQVARQLGWPERFPTTNEMTDRAHFFRAYDRAVDQAMDEEITLPDVKEFIESRQGKELESGDD